MEKLLHRYHRLEETISVVYFMDLKKGIAGVETALEDELVLKHGKHIV